MTDSTDKADSRGRRALIAIAWALLWAVFLAAYVQLVSSLALIDPDEGRNAEVAREMLESGDFVVPHLNELPYLDKPVLLFAAGALSMRALGVNEFAARLPALASTVATVGLVVAFGWIRFGRDAGLVAGMLLASSPLVLAFAGIVIFDAPMMLWVTCATMAFHLALEHGQQGWRIAAWAAVGLAVLTKGPVGFVLPMLIGIGDALANRRPVSRLFSVAGLAVFVLPAGLWFLAVTLRHPEFPHYAFVRETFERVATDSMRRTGPIYYFLPILIAGAFPTMIVLLAGARGLVPALRARGNGMRDEFFLVLWTLLPLIFFSLSQSKRPGYILPVVPAIALLGARALQLAPGTLRKAMWIAAPAAAVAGVALLLAGESVTALIRDAPAVAEHARAAAPYVGAGLLGTAGLALLGLRWRGAGLAALVTMPMVLLLVPQNAYLAMSERRSERDLAQVIHHATDGEIRLIAIGTYSPSLTFYLGTPVLLSTDSAAELRSNYIKDYADVLRERPESPLEPVDWWIDELHACQPGTIFLVNTRTEHEGPRDALAAALPLLFRDRNYEAYGPCGTGAR